MKKSVEVCDEKPQKKKRPDYGDWYFTPATDDESSELWELVVWGLDPVLDENLYEDGIVFYTAEEAKNYALGNPRRNKKATHGSSGTDSTRQSRDAKRDSESERHTVSNESATVSLPRNARLKGKFIKEGGGSRYVPEKTKKN